MRLGTTCLHSEMTDMGSCGSYKLTRCDAYLPGAHSQFHPEATGGPDDTGFLFDMFVSRVRNPEQAMITTIKLAPPQPPIRKVVLLGSGGLTIGQARFIACLTPPFFTSDSNGFMVEL